MVILPFTWGAILEMDIKDIPLLFSDDILAFIKKVKTYVRHILSNEMALCLKRERFSYGKYSYPLHIVVFEHPNKLGYFSSSFYEIGINKALMFVRDEKILLNVIRHEIAHYLTFIEYGDSVDAHGKEFRGICDKYNWGKDVYLSSVTFSKDDLLKEKKTNERILRKIEKLLALSSSSSINESTQAALKANELLLKHNVDAISNNEDFVLKRILSTKRSTIKLQAISDILRSFFVYPVLNHSKKGIYLEISGKMINVEIAEYVGYFLNNKMEELWDKTKKEKKLKGLTAKNSFFRGLAKGYLDKISICNTQNGNTRKILVIEKQLETQVKLIYPKLKNSKASYKHHELANQAGKIAGNNLQIQKGIKPTSSPQKGFLLKQV